jgi:hypothetical protein
MKRRIDTDTSAFGVCFDAEFREPSERLFKRFRSAPGDPDPSGGGAL